ncbi:hypothetical protein ACFV1L_10540 [Kitasatospora sp. NPDC059646]|uniref:hypothetical protein n=1 Tax=Kitasatospora sp. NPDC059646 TaxID=3346893 RepID=UPI00368A9ECA
MTAMPISPDDIPIRSRVGRVIRTSPLTGKSVVLDEDDAVAVIVHFWPWIEASVREQVAQEIEAEAEKTADENPDAGLYLAARIARDGSKPATEETRR